MPALHSSSAGATALLLALTTAAALFTQLALCQTLKPPQCPDGDSESVCNAVLHFRDRIVDQGQYCNGCRNCSGPEVPLTAAHSFVWQHFEHPDLMVQFLKCGAFPAVTKRCPDAVAASSGGEAADEATDAAAAVFVSPSDSWNPRLQELRCKCPGVNAASSIPLYQLRSWSLQDDQWVYEFVCPRLQCQVADQQQLQRQQKKQQQQQPHQQPASSLNAASANTLAQPASLSSPASSSAASSREAVCAEKRQSEPGGPVSVTFKCTCPPGYHCVIHDVVLKADDASKGGGGGGGGGGGNLADGDWQPLVVKYCQRVVMATTNGTEEGGNS